MESTFTNSSGNGGSNQSTCFEHIDALNQDLHPYETLSLLAPIDETVWSNRTTTWLILFKIAIGVLALPYLALGITSVVLIIKKNSLRISTKTFFAVYLSMAILGFSRAALLILDPYGILGYIRDSFPGWVIISRFMAALGFPSLVGSCSLIILTLVKLVNAHPGKQWYEYWKYVLVLIAIPYAIGLGAECMGHSHTYAALFAGIICEALFVVWGLFICTAYLAAGTRLLKNVRKRHRRATRTSEFPHQRETEIYHRSHNTRKMAATRKILTITFGTAMAGILYSLISAGVLVLLLLLIFGNCMGGRRPTNSTIWLAMQFANHLSELLLATLITYSITDVSQLVSCFKCSHPCHGASIRETENRSNQINAISSMGSTYGVQGRMSSATQDVAVRASSETTGVPKKTSKPAKTDSGISVESEMEEGQVFLVE